MDGKCRPILRRRHPHRYWVGSGDNKHLEVRWIDEIRVNGKRERDGATTTLKQSTPGLL